MLIKLPYRHKSQHEARHLRIYCRYFLMRHGDMNISDSSFTFVPKWFQKESLDVHVAYVRVHRRHMRGS